MRCVRINLSRNGKPYNCDTGSEALLKQLGDFTTECEQLLCSEWDQVNFRDGVIVRERTRKRLPWDILQYRRPYQKEGVFQTVSGPKMEVIKPRRGSVHEIET